MERVLEVDQVVLAGLARIGDAGLADRDAVGQPGRLDGGPRPRDGVRLELDADQLELGEALGHRHQPASAAAVDVGDAAAPRQVGDELGQLGERLLEEDRDVLRGQALDRQPVAIRPVADGLAGPEEVDHAAPVERGDRGMDELAAQELRALGVEQDRRNVAVDRQATVLERDQVMGIGGPGPRLDGDRLAAGLRGQLRGGQPVGAGGAQAREQAELDAEVHQPRAVEAAQARDQVVESIVMRHPGRIVAWRASPAARAGYRSGTDGIACNGR